jgi:transcriptional regulator with XRE-family HTH domain
MKRVKPPVGAFNPLTRLRKAAGLTQENLALRAQVTRQFVIRAEQAVYPDPPVGLVNTLLELNYDLDEDGSNDFNDSIDFEDLDIVELAAQYKAYQVALRKQHYGVLATRYNFSNTSLFDHELEHPFKQWRKDSNITSRIAISKYYCVHPATVFKFEEQPYLTTHVPPELVTALIDSGYPKELLDSLQKAYDTYKQYLRRKAHV